MTRQEVIDYAASLPSVSFDMPFENDFDTLVLRHADSRKWFALIFFVPSQYFDKKPTLFCKRDNDFSADFATDNATDFSADFATDFSKNSEKLKKSDKKSGNNEKMVDCINLKCEEQLATILTAANNGVYPAYHMNKRLWITIPLDNCDIKQLLKLVDLSYELTDKRKKTTKKTV